MNTPTNSSTPPVTQAVLGCSKCGATLPEEAQFCLKCGKPVSSPPKAAAERPEIEMLPPESHRPRSKRRWILWLVLALIALAIAWVLTSDSPFAEGVQELVGSKHDQAILDSSFSISPHVFRYYKFALPEGSMNVAVVGQFTAAAESRNNTRGKDEHKDQDNDNTIEVYVLTEPAFTIWQNGYATSSLYESGKVAEGTVQMQLPAGPGIYYLVFSNRSSTKTAKAVRASVLLRYKSWLPEWFRRMKDRFWNWIGV